MSPISNFLGRIDALTLRERGLTFVIVLSVFYFAWDLLLFSPLDQQRETLTARVTQVEQDIARLNAAAEQLAQARSRDPDADNRRRLIELRGKASSMRTKVYELTDSLVPPETMSQLLEAVFPGVLCNLTGLWVTVAVAVVFVMVGAHIELARG